MKRTPTKHEYRLCINNEDADDLQIRKLYRVLPDARAAEDDYLRVIDDSDEDYLYPAEYFVRITLPEEARQALFTKRKTKKKRRTEFA